MNAQKPSFIRLLRHDYTLFVQRWRFQMALYYCGLSKFFQVLADEQHTKHRQQVDRFIEETRPLLKSQWFSERVKTRTYMLFGGKP